MSDDLVGTDGSGVCNTFKYCLFIVDFGEFLVDETVRPHAQFDDFGAWYYFFDEFGKYF